MLIRVAALLGACDMGSFGELRISQQEVIQGAKFCQSINDLAVSSVPRVV